MRDDDEYEWAPVRITIIEKILIAALIICSVVVSIHWIVGK